MTDRTEEEQRYDKIVAACALKPAGHVSPMDAIDRIYTVTTVASSPRYGGTRTVAVCTTFSRAREIVETNEGDIWEYSYKLAIIEVARADCLYGGVGFADSEEGVTQFWYRWEGERDGGAYQPIEIPEDYRGIIAWAF